MVHPENPQFLNQEISIRDDLKLRLIQISDAERILEIFQSDPNIQTSVTWTAGHKTLQDVRLAIERLQKDPSLRYAILDGDQVVGYVGAWKDRGYFGGTIIEDEYGMGYFCDPGSRGKGIITDATKTLMEHIQSINPVKSFALYIEDSNTPSQSVAKKLGFQSTEKVYEEPILGSTERRWEKVLNNS